MHEETSGHRHARLTSEKAGATSLRWRFHSSPSDATRLGPKASRILYGPIGFGKRERAPTTSCMRASAWVHAFNCQSQTRAQRTLTTAGSAM